MANPLKEFVVPYSGSATVFNEGDTGSEMYVIQSGSVEIFRKINGEKRFQRTLEKGDFFGEMSLLEGLPRTATAVTLEDSELIVINGAVFDQMIKSNIEIAVRMLRKLSMRLRETTEQLDALLGAEGGGQTLGGVEESGASGAAGEYSFVFKSKGADRQSQSDEPEQPPVLAQFIAEESLKVFQIYKEITTIGRQDPVTGITPDIDLTGTFYLAEEVGTLNGTYINGKRIPTGILTPIKSGAQVGFGMLRLKFVEARQSKE
jgi:CRP-like cAMP-binding protein